MKRALTCRLSSPALCLWTLLQLCIPCKHFWTFSQANSCAYCHEQSFNSCCTGCRGAGQQANPKGHLSCEKGDRRDLLERSLFEGSKSRGLPLSPQQGIIFICSWVQLPSTAAWDLQQCSPGKTSPFGTRGAAVAALWEEQRASTHMKVLEESHAQQCPEPECTGEGAAVETVGHYPHQTQTKGKVRQHHYSTLHHPQLSQIPQFRPVWRVLMSHPQLVLVLGTKHISTFPSFQERYLSGK